ncbi:MAG: type II secretion system protein [Trueperaceae bacterium]|nr:type II secretion system protein [Trueperaceae bacterium]
MKKHQGITVVELLVAAAIFVIVLSLIFNGLLGSSRAVNTVITESEVIQDLRVAGQIMTDNLSRAVYIYPPGTQIQLNKSVSASVRNPATGKNVWTIGQDPIIAFLQAPQDPFQDPENCPDPKEPDKVKTADACLRFIAYYVLHRENFVKADSAFKAFLQDDANKDTWMLFEFRDVLPMVGRLDITNPPPVVTSGGRAYLLADYLKMGSGFLPFNEVNCQVEGVLDPECNDIVITPETLLNYRETVARGEFSLEVEYKQRGKVIRSPVLTFPIAPRNLYAE